MTTSIKTIFITTIVLFAFTTRTQSQTYSKEIEDKIKSVENNLTSGWFKIEGQRNWTLDERMKYYNAQGISIAVINNFKIEWAKGYGWADSSEKRPVTINTMFRAGSISKSLNAMGLLKLAEEKNLDIYSDINNYLTSWKFPYDTISKNKKISIADLLSHTAGLSVYGFHGYKKGDSLPTIYQTLDGKRPANNSPVRSEIIPGTRQYHYSGGASTIAQLIVSDVSKQPYDKYFDDKVFKPLGMTNSSYTQFPTKDIQKRFATGYYANGKEVEGKYPIYPEMGAAGLWTTPTDLCKYIIETQLALKGKSNKVLSNEMTKKRLIPETDSSLAIGFTTKNNASGMGLFIDIEKNKTAKYFWHGGGGEGFTAHFYGSLEDGKGVAVMVNLHSIYDGGKLLKEVMNSVAISYNWEDYYSPILKKTVVQPDSILDKYIGTYKSKNNGKVTIIYKRDGKYWYDRLNDFYNPVEMAFTSSQDFFNKEFSTEKSFYSDSLGNLKGIRTSLRGKLTDEAEKIKLLSLSDELLNRYIGTYEQEANNGEPFSWKGKQEVIFVKKDNNLWMNIGGKSFRTYFYSTSEFYLLENNQALYKFITNENNIVVGYIKNSGYDEDKAFKK
jgi:CubicO group peptidase (beta-lactamase class C family)